MGWFSRRRHAVVAVAAFALSSGLLVSAATAEPPSEDDIAAAREAESRTASSVAELEVELARLATQLEDSTIAAQLANEDYLGAQAELDEATRRAEEARADAEAAQAEVEVQRAGIGAIARSAYRSGPGALSQVEPLLSADSFENAMQRATMTERMGTRADESLQRFQASELVATTFHRRADDAAAEQEAATAALAAAAQSARETAASAETQLALSADRREALIAQLAVQRGTTAELEHERQDALDQERRRREEERARSAALEAAREQEAASRATARPERQAAQTEPTSAQQPAPDRPAPEPTRPAPEPTRPVPEPTRPAPEPTRPAPEPTRPAPQPTAPARPAPEPEPAPQPPPSSSNAARAALDWARTQVGKPYVWGAAGPNSYDCSGLTQAAFAQAGVSLPRTTRAQYAATSRVSVDALQVGDLVFYSDNGAASGIYHVAIYAGDGMRLHAPSPGKNVELVPMYWPNVLPYGGRV